MFLFDEIDAPSLHQLPTSSELWRFLPLGYLFTIAIETPVLLLGLPKPVSFRQRLWCGVWLTACTYPIVILVLPTIFFDSSRSLYLAVAETFAPVGECFLFWLAFRSMALGRSGWIQAMAAIVIANLASFGAGEIMDRANWFGWF